MTNRSQRAINRSGHYVCDTCSTRSRLITHHINGRKVPDAEAAWNKCQICPNCHQDVHEDPPRLIITGWVYTTAGRTLEWTRPKK